MIELRSIIHDSILYTNVVNLFEPSTGFHEERKAKKINLEAKTRFYPQPPGDFVDPFTSNDSLSQNSTFYASKSKFIKKPFEQPLRMRSKKERRIHAKVNPPLISFTSAHEYIPPGIPQEPVDEDEPETKTKTEQKTETPSTLEKNDAKPESENSSSKPDNNTKSEVTFNINTPPSKDKPKIPRTLSSPANKEVFDIINNQVLDEQPKSAQYMTNKEKNGQ